MYKNATNTLVCDCCKTIISIGDLFYLDKIDNHCQACRTKKIKAPQLPRYKQAASLAAIGSLRWKTQLDKALQVKAFNMNVSSAVSSVIAKKIIAGSFGVELKKTGIEKAQAYLIDLHDQGNI